MKQKKSQSKQKLNGKVLCHHRVHKIYLKHSTSKTKKMPKAPNGFFAAGKVSFIPGITGGSAAAWILMKAAASTTKWLYSREIQEEKVDAALKEQQQENKGPAENKWSFSPDGQLGLLLRDEKTTYYILWAGCLVFEYIGKDGVKINRTLNDRYRNGDDNITENIRRLIFIQLLWTMAKQTVKEDDIKILQNNKLATLLTKKSTTISLIQNLKNKLPDETHAEPNGDSYIKENILYFIIDNKFCDVILSKEGMDTTAKCPLGENWTPIGKLKCVKAN